MAELLGSSYFSSASVTGQTTGGEGVAGVIDGDLAATPILFATDPAGPLVNGAREFTDGTPPTITINAVNPIDADGLVLYNDYGTPTDGVKDMTVTLYNSDGDVLGTENISASSTDFEGTISFSQNYSGVASFEIQVNSIYDASNDPSDSRNDVMQIREIGLSGSVSPVVCFTAGMKIDTLSGPIAVEDLQIGDMVKTLDRGAQPVRFVYRRKVRAVGDLKPIVFEKNAIGNSERFIVSQKHRIYIPSIPKFRSQNNADYLVEAIQLVDYKNIRVANEFEYIEYFHIMFDQHELIWCGEIISESWQPSKRNLKRDPALKRELLKIFPELAFENGTKVKPAAVRPTIYNYRSLMSR